MPTTLIPSLTYLTRGGWGISHEAAGPTREICQGRHWHWHLLSIYPSILLSHMKLIPSFRESHNHYANGTLLYMYTLNSSLNIQCHILYWLTSKIYNLRLPDRVPVWFSRKNLQCQLCPNLFAWLSLISGPWYLILCIDMSRAQIKRIRSSLELCSVSNRHMPIWSVIFWNSKEFIFQSLWI